MPNLDYMKKKLFYKQFCYFTIQNECSVTHPIRKSYRTYFGVIVRHKDRQWAHKVSYVRAENLTMVSK